MKFEVKRDELLARLNALVPFMGRPNLIPILGCLHMATDGNSLASLTLTATDLETALVTDIEADVREHGSTCIPLDRLRDYVANLAGETVAFALDGKGRIAATSGKDKAKLAVLDAESFPEIPPATGDSIPIPVKALEGALRYGLIASDRPDSDTMRHIGAIHLQVDNQRLLLLATEGKKLSVCDLGPVNIPWSNVAIHRDSAAKIVRLLGGIKTEVSGVCVRHDDNHVFFETEAGVITIRQMSGVRFQDYKRIVGRKRGIVCTVPSADLKRIVSSAAVASDPTESSVSLKFENNSITASLGGQVGEIHAHADCDTSGGSIELRVNRGFILGALGEMGAAVQIEMSDSKNAVRFTSPGDETRQHFIAPMMLPS
jgi:DNA polymerase-3 subunit beta